MVGAEGIFGKQPSLTADDHLVWQYISFVTVTVCLLEDWEMIFHEVHKALQASSSSPLWLSRNPGSGTTSIALWLLMLSQN